MITRSCSARPRSARSASDDGSRRARALRAPYHASVTAELDAILANLPTQSGVYLMKDAAGTVL